MRNRGHHTGSKKRGCRGNRAKHEEYASEPLPTQEYSSDSYNIVVDSPLETAKMVVKSLPLKFVVPTVGITIGTFAGVASGMLPVDVVPPALALLTAGGTTAILASGDSDSDRPRM